MFLSLYRFCRFTIAKIDIFPRLYKKMQEKIVKMQNFQLSVIIYQLFYVPLHRFFRKHNELSCDGELSISINNLILE